MENTEKMGPSKAIIGWFKSIDPMLILIVALTTTLYFYSLGVYPFGPDESTYTSQAAIWAGHDQYRENFLQYSRSATNFQIQQQIMAIFFKIFAINEFNARIPTAIMGILSVIFIYILAKELFSRKMALLSALFTGINGYSLHFNKQVNLDTPLVFFMILSILFIVKWRKTKKDWYFYLFLISVILTTMAKVIIVVPLVAIIFAYLYIQKDLAKGLKMLIRPISILIILAALLYAGYFIFRIVGLDEFIRTLTYASGRETRNVSIFYIQVVTLMLGYALPIIAILGVAYALRHRSEGDILCLIWLMSIMLFFTYYPVQGYNYIFPIIPPVMLLSARAIDGLIDYEGSTNSRTTPVILAIMILLSVYPTINILDNPDKVVGSVAPIRFDSLKYSVLKDASVWLRNNSDPNSNVAVYTFADDHVVAYYSGLKTYTINNFPGYYLPTDKYAKITWNTTDVIKMVEDKKIDYIVYMNEPRLTKNLTTLYEVEGIDFKSVYNKNYITPDWYRLNNINITIFEVVKDKPIRMENISKSYFSVIVLPNTQVYLKNRPDIFKKQIEWVNENLDTLNIKFVVNTGNLVDTGSSINQWNIANKNINMLDVPYLFVPGDHDYNGDPRLRDRTNFDTFFNYTRFNNDSWYGGHYPSNGNENSYGLFSSTAGDFLVMGLDICPTDDVLTWADNTINANGNKKIILITNSYLSEMGDRIAAGKPSSCTNIGIVGNDGEDIWNKLVSMHQNIVLVLSGHRPGAAQKIDTINGYPINQILQNYQEMSNGGNGYLRIFTFMPDVHMIDVRTYSPYVNQYDTSSANQFSVAYKDSSNGTMPITISIHT